MTVRVSIRKQGGAAIMTIPAEILKRLDLEIGSTLEIAATQDAFTARPARARPRMRYSLAELLEGVSPDAMDDINRRLQETREGEAIGHEIA